MITLKKLELSQAFDVKPSLISYHVKKGNLIVTDDDMIDINNTKNVIQFQQWINDGYYFDPSRIVFKDTHIAKRKGVYKIEDIVIHDLKRRIKEKKKTEDKKTAIDKIVDLETEKKIIEIEYKKTQTRLNEIKEQKYRGELIPTDAVQTLFNNSIELIRSSLLQKSRGIAEIFRQKTGMSQEEFIDMQKDLTVEVNDFVVDFKISLIKNVDTIINEYKEVRGRGEVK